MSGPAAFEIASSLAGSLPPARRASLRALRDADGLLLDRALLLRFEAVDSATGDDLVEFHCHGGLAVVTAVEQALLADPRTKAAQPGEFTRRALDNGRIDLAQVYGLADLLEAETETQRRNALSASEGYVSRQVQDWIDRLAMLAAEVEASIDYADEEDVAAQGQTIGRVVEQCRVVAAEIDAMLAVPPVERWRDGIRVVLAGPPNAGKSTLLNLLAGRDAAIVSPIAGTTRDRIDIPVRRDGVAYLLSDTAGLRDDPDDPIERLGIDRARHACAEADLILWMGDGEPPMDGAVRIHARSDLPGRGVTPANAIATSVRVPETVSMLWEVIAGKTARQAPPAIPFHAIERAYCRETVAALTRASDCDDALLADTLRVAMLPLARIRGQDVTELTLDRLFSRFCVGK